jgi:hypothetical protein
LHFADLLEYLHPTDYLVLNNTKVLAAGFYFLRPAEPAMSELKGTSTLLADGKHGLWGLRWPLKEVTVHSQNFCAVTKELPAGGLRV